MFVNVFLYHFGKREECDEQTAEQRFNHFATGLPQESTYDLAAPTSQNICTRSSKTPSGTLVTFLAVNLTFYVPF